MLYGLVALIMGGVSINGRVGDGSVIVIRPSTLSGTLRLPPSKSHAMRWLTLASMDESPTKIEMWEIGEDVQALIDCLAKMGVLWDGKILTGGKLQPPESVLDCKNSGTAMRFLIAQAATCNFELILDGDTSLRARSSLHLLESIGIEFSKQEANQEYPLLLRGPVTNKKIEIDVSKTSQFHSAVLLMAPRTKGFDLTTVGHAVSRKHSELTWDLCKLTGATHPGQPWQVSCPDVKIPADASMMAFAKLSGLMIENTPSKSDLIGHDLEQNEIRDSNDLISPMAAWLALGDGGKITGASHAAFKESNRITKTVELLAKFGLESSANPDGLIVPGGQTPKAPQGIVETYDDHRLQMTAIILASICGGKIRSSNLHKVAWPSFLDQLISCGLKIQDHP